MAVDGTRSTWKHIEEALQLNFARWGTLATASWSFFMANEMPLASGAKMAS